MKRKEGIYRGVYTYGLERISESDQVSVEGVPNDPLFYLYDGRGSVTQLVNTANTVKDKYRYTPFGVPMPGGQLTPNTRLFNNPYGYNGEDYDIESGLQFLRARYYNPETARFITRDSYLGDVMEPLSLNRYAYTANNPLRYTDPSGHKYVSEDEGNKQVEAYNNLYYKSLSQPAKNGPVLKVGSTNKGSIKELQNMLIDLGYDLGPSGADGYFGEKTKTAVIKFQKSNGLDTDGIVGAKTWKSLQREQTDNENIKSVMKIKEHDYVAEKTSQSRTVSKNDVACGDLGDISSKAPTISEIFNNMVDKEKKIVYIDGVQVISDKIVIGSKDIEARLNYGVDNASTFGEKLEAGVKSTLYRHLKNYNINKYEYIVNTTPADLSLEQGEMAADIVIGEVAGAIVVSGIQAAYYVKNTATATGVASKGVLEIPEGGIAGDNIGIMLKGGVNSISDDTLKWLNKGDADNLVYYGTKDSEAVYTGITKQDLAKRLYQHNYGPKGKGLDYLETQLSDLTRNQARAVEQYLIEHGSANALNKANSISPNSQYYKEALQWAENYIKSLK